MLPLSAANMLPYSYFQIIYGTELKSELQRGKNVNSVDEEVKYYSRSTEKSTADARLCRVGSRGLCLVNKVESFPVTDQLYSTQ
ncbi:hypothetical protein C5167_018610, partial [Papaver somniferum]